MRPFVYTKCELLPHVNIFIKEEIYICVVTADGFCVETLLVLLKG